VKKLQAGSEKVCSTKNVHLVAHLTWNDPVLFEL